LGSLWSGAMFPALSWSRFQRFYVEYPELGLALDASRMNFDDAFLARMQGPIQHALEEMAALEGGAVANPDEKRMVGHYWLRCPELAPEAELGKQIRDAIVKVKAFTQSVKSGAVKGSGGKFQRLLVVGIGGSALGPQFVAQALGTPNDALVPVFFDNTDPDGMDRVLGGLGSELGRTLCLVISKSGGTKETRNGMLEAKRAYEAQGLNFAAHTVAITGEGSALDALAVKDGWLDRFPMWDWVGGRTSETSAVGLLPAALQGIDIEQLLAGAKAADAITRRKDAAQNPAAQLALAWYVAGNGKGDKAMVILPYKDRLELFSRYLQQLVMESIGKEKDLQGKVVNQGLTVYGNKGSTDQHAYVQQLCDGTNNFFATFVEVLRDRAGAPFEVEPGITSGDFLSGFFLGTREALAKGNRESLTLTLDEVSPFSVGVLIALYERAVGLYATLVGINAYHQPGVEAGKKAAQDAIDAQGRILALLQSKATALGVEAIAEGIGRPNDAELVFKICMHLARNSRGVQRTSNNGAVGAQFAATK
jgi:glucose-6-phosphate isomerase